TGSAPPRGDRGRWTACRYPHPARCRGRRHRVGAPDSPGAPCRRTCGNAPERHPPRPLRYRWRANRPGRAAAPAAGPTRPVPAGGHVTGCGQPRVRPGRRGTVAGVTLARAAATAHRPAGRADPPTVASLLAAAVAAVPGGTPRPGQQRMAEAVAEAVTTGEHLLVQAGTGTGKSLAYLVPALLVDRPVVVSTATLALQAQLVDHDLPRLAEAAEPLLGRAPRFAVLKGRHHYLCLAKLESSTAEEPDGGLFEMAGAGGTTWLAETGRLGQQIQRLRDWGLETATGDRDELDPGVDDTAWRQVS